MNMLPCDDADNVRDADRCFCVLPLARFVGPLLLSCSDNHHARGRLYRHWVRLW